MCHPLTLPGATNAHRSDYWKTSSIPPPRVPLSLLEAPSLSLGQSFSYPSRPFRAWACNASTQTRIFVLKTQLVTEQLLVLERLAKHDAPAQASSDRSRCRLQVQLPHWSPSCPDRPAALADPLCRAFFSAGSAFPESRVTRAAKPDVGHGLQLRPL